MVGNKNKNINNVVVFCIILGTVVAGSVVIAGCENDELRTLTTDKKIEMLMDLRQNPNGIDKYKINTIKNSMTEAELELYEFKQHVVSVYIPTLKVNEIKIMVNDVVEKVNGFKIEDITVIVDGNNIYICIPERIQTQNIKSFIFNNRTYQDFYVDIFSEVIVSPIFDLSKFDKVFPLADVYDEELRFGVKDGLLQQADMLEAIRRHILSLPENNNSTANLALRF